MGKSQLSLTLPADTLPMPLVVEVTDEAEGGGVIGCGGGVVPPPEPPSPIMGRVCTTPLPPPVAPAVAAAPLPLALLSSAEFLSRVTRRTAPTRSLAIRDQDSMRLWASQQAAGPRPLIFCQLPGHWSSLLFYCVFCGKGGRWFGCLATLQILLQKKLLLQCS